MRIVLALLLYICATFAHSAPFVVSDPTTQTVTHCGIVINSDTKIDSPVETVTGGKRCKYDLTGYAPGALSIKATFINVDPVWGRQESVFSVPLVLQKPTSPVPPAGLQLLAQ